MKTHWRLWSFSLPDAALLWEAMGVLQLVSNEWRLFVLSFISQFEQGWEVLFGKAVQELLENNREINSTLEFSSPSNQCSFQLISLYKEDFWKQCAAVSSGFNLFWKMHNYQAVSKLPCVSPSSFWTHSHSEPLINEQSNRGQGWSNTAMSCIQQEYCLQRNVYLGLCCNSLCKAMLPLIALKGKICVLWDGLVLFLPLGCEWAEVSLVSYTFPVLCLCISCASIWANMDAEPMLNSCFLKGGKTAKFCRSCRAEPSGAVKWWAEQWYFLLYSQEPKDSSNMCL